ncbi:hypothetical protein NEF87_001213 [Candidatus Lokiarchaeum ossiferum]|uniref:Tetratricopeptide repeat protein n=1 Tax=Candidatus Lokiarchaeum ossiferum TaxID=2951803 RepID=A0ABY6HNP1_9ARCH|nr:hypothetical protein NEF87_001213 [Candidatus Lokiarchaeum sp. B-35]
MLNIMKEEHQYNNQDEFITYTKLALDEIQQSESKSERDIKLYDLMAYLISSSNDIAQDGDYYEAAGRLYSAAYYLEEFYVKNARKIYIKSIKFYDNYFHQVVIKGGVKEAANVALKIANIYRNKLKDRNNEENYIRKAIGLISNQIIILQNVGSPRDLCGRYLTLSILFTQLKDWSNVVISAQSAIEVGKLISDYSIISNAYHTIADAYEKLHGVSKSHEILLEAISYFIDVAEFHEVQSQNLHLSQLYQIIKTLYKKLNDFPHFQQYSRKEAGVYINLAKSGIKGNISKNQIGSYYRGAGLCYRETLNNYLDSASCFFIAGNYYHKAKKNLSAATNYEDAARMFEYLKNYRKAQELFQKAGKFYYKAGNSKSSIINYIAAYQMCEIGKFKCNDLLHLLLKVLEMQIEVDQSDQNYFSAASLSLEKLNYMHKLNLLSKKELDDNFREILSFYLQIFHNFDKIAAFNMKGYILVLICVLSHVLDQKELRDEVKTKLVGMTDQIEFKFVDFASLFIQIYPNSFKSNLILMQSKFSTILTDDDFSELRALVEILSKVQSF